MWRQEAVWSTVLLDRVRPEDVHRLARYYWVRRITLQ
jgi:hypothetical protein